MKEKRFNYREVTLTDEEELMAKQVKEGLEKIDQWNPVSIPNIQWFQQQVEMEKKRIRKKQWKDLLTFVSFAVFMLVILLAIVYRQPIVFLYIQLVGIIVLPFAFDQKRKKVSSE